MTSAAAVLWCSGYNVDRKAWSALGHKKFVRYDDNPDSPTYGKYIQDDKSLTQQNQANDADINVIMKRYGVTGHLPNVEIPPRFGNFDTDIDFRDALEIVAQGQRMFSELDAVVRARFENNPAKFVEFCYSAPREELEKIGIATPKPVPPPDKVMKVEVVSGSVTEAKPK